MLTGTGLRQWFGKLAAGNRRRKARRGCSPAASESLEPRTLLTSFNVTNLNDSGPGSLRQAVLDANANPGADDVYMQLLGTIELQSTIDISESLKIQGPGAAQLSVSGRGQNRVFNLGGAGSNNYDIRGISIINGSAGIVFGGGGGGIRIADSDDTLFVDGVIFSGNYTNQGEGGGALSSSASAVTIVNSSFYQNTSDAIFGAGAAIRALGGSLTIGNSTLTRNATNILSPDDSSTIFIDAVGGENAGLMLFNSTVFDNNTLTNVKYLSSGSGSMVNLELHNSVIAQPRSGGSNFSGVSQFGGAKESFSYGFNISGDNSSELNGFNDRRNLDPQLASARQRGSAWVCEPLFAGSPVINAGRNIDGFSPFRPAEFDNRGSGFPRTRYGTIDIGAFEAQDFVSFPYSSGSTPQFNDFNLTYTGTTDSGSVSLTYKYQRPTGEITEVNLGTFSMSDDLFLRGNDFGSPLVNIQGTSFTDVIDLTSSEKISTNGSDVFLRNILNVMLAGGNGDDTYLLDGDAGSGLVVSIDESAASSDVDTIDLSSTSEGVRIDLNSMIVQQVTTNLRLILTERAIENVVGGSGNDSLSGNYLHNRIRGMSGNDQISGRGGNDVLEGGTGLDRFIFGTPTFAERDSVIENAGEGDDTLNFAALNSSVNINLGLTSPQVVHRNRTLQLSNAIESVIGGSGNDRLTGSVFRNILKGNGGNDILLGGNGNDRLEGGSGRDILIGGMGADVLNGGNDEDVVITGRTAYDNNSAALNVIRTQWTSNTSYSSRVSSLRSGVGNPRVSLKAASTVLNDIDHQIDDAQASAGIDWFFLRFNWEGQGNAGSGQVDWL